MFNRKNNEPDRLEAAINALFDELAVEEGHTDRYNQLSDQLSKLIKLREVNSQRKVSPDTLVLAGANLLGILLIVGQERAGVVASKALGFVTKLR